jgi:predicted acyltransferase (DUF342 family)
VERSSTFKEIIMYKMEIDISTWGADEKITIESNDFDKIQIIQEFLEFQMENGWAVDYVAVIEDDEDDSDDEALAIATEAAVAQD